MSLGSARHTPAATAAAAADCCRFADCCEGGIAPGAAGSALAPSCSERATVSIEASSEFTDSAPLESPKAWDSAEPPKSSDMSSSSPEQPERAIGKPAIPARAPPLGRGGGNPPGTSISSPPPPPPPPPLDGAQRPPPLWPSTWWVDGVRVTLGMGPAWKRSRSSSSGMSMDASCERVGVRVRGVVR